MPDRQRIALLSTDDKRRIDEIARALHEAGFLLLSSGGTRAKIIELTGLPVVDVSEWTGFPAILGHRLVTISSRVAAALLANMSNPDHVADMQELGFVPIDFVYFGLYDYFERLRQERSSWDSILENMDVGGPMALAAAAKGGRIVVTNPHDALRVANTLASGDQLDERALRLLQLEAVVAGQAHVRKVIAAMREELGLSD